MFDRKRMEEIAEAARTTDGRLELIRALIPLGLKAVNDELIEEFERLTGAKHRHDESLNRWGRQPASVYLGEEKFRIEVLGIRKGMPRYGFTVMRNCRSLEGWMIG